MLGIGVLGKVDGLNVRRSVMSTAVSSAVGVVGVVGGVITNSSHRKSTRRQTTARRTDYTTPVHVGCRPSAPTAFLPVGVLSFEWADRCFASQVGNTTLQVDRLLRRSVTRLDCALDMV